jgi:selenocysteine lyase/cysteine desulfurase
VMVHAADSRGAVADLALQGIVVDSRGPFVRVSPHFYNTVEECDRFVDALRPG